MKEANPKFCFDHFAGVGMARGGGGIRITSLLLRPKIMQTEIIPIVYLYFVNFLRKLEFRFPGRNGIARLSVKTTIYFSMILFF